MPSAAAPLIEWLGRAGADVDALGGKGASLDRLARLGHPVPPGFCLTTAAFRAQLSSLHDADAAHLPTLLLEAALTDELQRAIGEALDRLVEQLREMGVAPRFAVRSSAIGEDGSAASYAGLHETELDVPPAGVEGAVRRCWASLWSAPAMAYRQRKGLGWDDAAMAVVVQALVPADASAVAFTRHPVTNRQDQLVVTAVRGLGDAMVAGTVTPDTFVIDRESRAEVSFDPGEDPRGRSVDEADLRRLVDALLEVEAGFGCPIDVEAALAAGTWFLLQARPITTMATAARP